MRFKASMWAILTLFTSVHQIYHYMSQHVAAASCAGFHIQLILIYVCSQLWLAMWMLLRQGANLRGVLFYF